MLELGSRPVGRTTLWISREGDSLVTVKHGAILATVSILNEWGTSMVFRRERFIMDLNGLSYLGVGNTLEKKRG